ncbi:MAG: ferrous iron transport protein B [Desulfotomaculaceae bacterium]|nr:ferrous iron transport protein B [Desulfotomaculaceae bacterium]
MNDAIESRIPSGGRKIVLAGNPNVGKSAFFNALTGLYTDVANYPGTTLDIACGRYNGDVVIDTPGVYGVSSYSKEEEITRDIILAADIVVNIVDTVHLERDLFLTMQIIDMGVPIIVALNMADEAEREGMRINHILLEELLGIPVVRTVAVHHTGIDELKEKIYQARPGLVDSSLLEKISRVSTTCNRGEALLILEGDPAVSERCGATPGTELESIYRARRERANQVASMIVQETGKNQGLADKLGRWMLLPVTGFPLLMLTLWGVYELVGVFFAQTIVDFTEQIMMVYYEPVIQSLVGSLLGPESVLTTILAGQYGVLTLTVTYLIGLLLPLVLGIFLVMAILEDSGYLPRIATLVDRALGALGLNGQAVIPLILGFGCVTMACISTRLLPSDRERRIAIFLLAFGVPCSAQMAIIMAVFAGLGPIYLLLYILILFSILTTTGTLLGRYLPGATYPLLIELPPLRLPQPKYFIKKAWTRTYNFIKEALPLFAGGALFLSILEVAGLLQGLRTLLAPLTVNWLHLPPEIADVFIMGAIRKEFGAATIMNLHMLPIQDFVVMLTLTLTVPCIASTIVILKERGWREGLLMWCVIYALAFFIGGVTVRLLEAFSKSGALNAPWLFIFIICAMGAVLGLARFRPRKEE